MAHGRTAILTALILASIFSLAGCERSVGTQARAAGPLDDWRMDVGADGRIPNVGRESASPLIARDAAGQLCSLDSPSCAQSTTAGDRRGIRFSGGGEYLDAATAAEVQGLSAFTVVAWVRPDAPTHQSDGGTILNKEGEFELSYFDDGSLRFAVESLTPGWTWVNAGKVLSIGVWTHLTLVYSRGDGEVRLYANGSLAFGSNASGPVGDHYPQLNDLRVGGREKVPAAAFIGSVGEVMVFDRAIPENDIKSLAMSPTH